MVISLMCSEIMENFLVICGCRVFLHSITGTMLLRSIRLIGMNNQIIANKLQDRYTLPCIYPCAEEFLFDVEIVKLSRFNLLMLSLLCFRLRS